ncbi:MAG: hypothetical protein ACXW32_10840, partial [Limisphaerales bacterium]
MSKKLSVTELGDLVNELRATTLRLQETNARAEKETTVRKAALIRQSEAELQRLRDEQTLAREQITTQNRTQLDHLAKRTAARKTRITKAHATSRKRSLDRIDEIEGRRKFAVQKGILDTERGRDQRV